MTHTETPAQAYTRIVKETTQLYKHHKNLREQYLRAVQSRTAATATIADLRTHMEAAHVAALRKYSAGKLIRRRLVEEAPQAVLDAAHDYHKQLHYKVETALPAFPQLRPRVSDVVAAVMLTAGAFYYTRSIVWTGVTAVVAGLTTTVRTLLRRHHEFSHFYVAAKARREGNAESLQAAEQKLTELMQTRFAKFLVDELEARYQREILERAARSEAVQAAEVARYEKRQAGLAAWKARQAEAATAPAMLAAGAGVAAAVGTAVATDFVADELPALTQFDSLQSDPFEFFDQPTTTPSMFPDTNINGIPMIDNSGVDVHGQAFGDTSLF